MTTVEDDVRTALDVARALATTGVPVFVASPSAVNTIGFRLPDAWQQTVADPAALNYWQPDTALCAVMGCGVDLVDIDPRSGGSVEALVDALGGLPPIVAEVVTPSGGVHLFVPSMGVGSHDGILPGIDVKGGLPDGRSRGFAFLAPTVRTSKTTGERATYRWVRTPDPALIARPEGSEPWERLAGLVRAAYSNGTRVRPVGGPEWYRKYLENQEPQSQAAAERAINEKLGEVISWTRDSGSNFRQTLMRAAMTLGGYVGGGYLVEGDAWARLEQACSEVWGQPDEDDRLWISQGLGDGAGQPFPVYTPEDEALYGEAAQAVASTRTNEPRSVQRALGPLVFDLPRPYNDQEYAEEVLARAGGAYRYAADADTWLINDGRPVWTERKDLTENMIAMVARLMPLGDPDYPEKKGDYTPDNWRAKNRALLMSSAGTGRIARKIRALVAGGDHPCALEIADLDAEPEVLWAGHWPWDLRASVHGPALAAIDPGTPHLHTATCMPEVRPTPLWDTFVATVWPDVELRAWALRVLAISLAGYADAALPVLYGPERTGKTSLIVLLVKLLGTYGHAADPRLLAGADRAHASIIYVLKGRRLSFIDEGPRRGELAAAHLKALTGGGPLTGNAMRSNPVTFDPTHTLVMTTNDEPPITDPALRARMRIIPCEADQDAVRRARMAITPAVWEIEAPGVLARMIGECAAWLHDPASALPEAAPASLKARVDEIAAGQDPVRDWVVAWTVPTQEGSSTRDLYTAFVRWYGEHPLYRRLTPTTETRFGRSLTELGYPPFWGGDRGKTRFRALSVMNGGPGTAWGLPLPPTGAEGLPRVAEGFVAQPSAPYNQRSTPVFAESAEGAEGLLGPIEQKNELLLQKSDSANISGENRRSTPKPSASPDKNEVPPATTGVPRVGAEGLAQPSAGHEEVTEASEPIKARSVTKAEAARRAAEAKITKAEARRLVAEENRAAAIDAAAGEHIGLPAVATREGYVMPVTLEQAEMIVRTATARAGALTVDVETSGYPVGHVHHRLRTVQLGDEEAAVVLDPIEHADAIRTLLDEAPKLHAHSAAADLVPLAHAGLIDAGSGWARMFDTVIPAKLADPQSTGSDPGLKQLAGAVLGSAATAPGADEARTALFKAGGWSIGKQKFATQLTTPPERSGWAQVPSERATMVRYAASDVLDTAALARRLPEIPPAIMERERTAEEMTARVAHRGLAIDAQRLAELTAEHTQLQAEAAGRVRAFSGIDNPGSGQQVAAKLQALGAVLPVSDKGNASVAEHVLSLIKRTFGETPPGQLATAVLDYRHSTTVLGLFLAPYAALVEQGDGRMRPTVYTLGTDTGRMCLPTDHRLVTPDGYVKADSLREGMLTMDATGQWVKVSAVHRYDDAPLVTLWNRGIELAATPEHRWLTSLEHDGDYARRKGRPVPPRALRTLDARPRLRVHLAPEVAPFDFDVRTIPAETDAQRFAALVGMLVTDGRCVDSEETEVGLRAYVYQTEAKFHAEFRRVIPDAAVMYDHITTSGELHHEIRLRARWLRPRLEAAGLATGLLLKESPDLYGWAARLPLDELRAFLSACWLADGSLSDKSLSCGSANLRAVLTLAAYRLGAVAYEANYGPSEWSTRDRLGLRFRESVITTRKSVRGEARSDVWCVTTETGTFTAVSPNGTVYLTGNSSVRPNIQQLPREGGVRSVVRADPGHVLISADFSGVELRGAAALSQDQTMIHMITEEDAGRFDGFHWAVARQAFGPDATKGDRYVAKRGVFGHIYGGGVATLAKQVGVTETDMGAIVESLKVLTPGLAQWSDQIRGGVRRGLTQFPAYSGRIIHFPPAYPHKSPNYAIQGTCRELLVDALVRWRDTRWGDATLLPVHDELVIQVPAEDADAALAELVRCMEGELYGVKIVAEASSPSPYWTDSV